MSTSAVFAVEAFVAVVFDCAKLVMASAAVRKSAARNPPKRVFLMPIV
jgi:hypothetical protein